MTTMDIQTVEQTILIVDDERFNINLLNGLLKDDYKIMVATNGRQALSAARNKKPDLILLDVVMPNMDGFAVCRELKESEATKNIPIIFITDMSQSEYETKAFDIGAVDYITKPFHHAVVMARVSTHMQLKRKTDLLADLAMLDGLTMIPNRRTFDIAHQKEWDRARRLGTELSILMVDVDYFKKYNDRFGHAYGDKCLQRIAGVLKECLRRPGDTIARYGGEEFVAVLPNTDLEGALMVGELFRSSVLALLIPQAEETARPFISISVGVSTAIPCKITNSSSDYLTACADKQLYLSKENGRNIVSGAMMSSPS